MYAFTRWIKAGRRNLETRVWDLPLFSIRNMNDNQYELIREKMADAPVYRGSVNDWWGNGVGSTPYAVKHYKEGLRLAHICERLEKKTGQCNETLRETGEENALLYAEHT